MDNLTTIINTFKIPIINMLLVLSVTIADIEMAMRFLLVGLSIGYTAWKWFMEYKKRKL